MAIKRVAVIGAGPAGAITDRGRRQAPVISSLSDLASRTADKPLAIPAQLPAQTPKVEQPRFAESSIYPYLETNVHSIPMEFSQEPLPAERSQRSIAVHGADTPFRHWSVMQRYIQGLVQRRGYEDFVSYDTTVELAEKVGGEWKLTLRKGHYRGRDQFKGKRVVVVGASVSAADISFDLTSVAKHPVESVVIGHTANGYFGDEAFNHPAIRKRPTISHVEGRTVHFIDGASVADVDHVIFGTGYSWTLPFLPSVQVRNNRVPGLYQHVVYRADPTLFFVGAVAAGLTFKVYEWQAVLAARVLAGRATLPPEHEQRAWEEARIAARGDGVKFTLVFPDFEEYFETLRALAGPGAEGVGRKLPPFRREWFRAFLEGHERRKEMWRRENEKARALSAKL
ncbi:unnamed protein product [Parascedosporium putredinis]|uniref:Thiol-specific monooxygenase n=1 Tax=Parascedosporium putredinis TaxID=1442378 RepID=A0A9P1H8B2_9PEZI|nr:unnamed protein product [Parascedosporium putredinis]CAI8000574.1 unnamed protein product [Parascedosporium putredinis]